MKINIHRTTATDPDFIALVKYLDTDLAGRDGADHAYYAQFNFITNIKYAIVAYENDKAVACGAIKAHGTDAMEVKRMYTLPEYRGKGMATMILKALEGWAVELSYKKCILETGKRQPEAIKLYKKNGYQRIQNYRQYVGIENSVCFEKVIR